MRQTQNNYLNMAEAVLQHFDNHAETWSNIGTVAAGVAKGILSVTLQKQKSKDYFVKYFEPIEKEKLQMSQKYLPKQDFLERLLDTIFEKNKEDTICN
jgi:hypothetical protein